MGSCTWQGVPEGGGTHLTLTAYVLYPAIDYYLVEGAPHIVFEVFVAVGYGVFDGVHLVGGIFPRPHALTAESAALLHKVGEIKIAEIQQIGRHGHRVQLVAGSARNVQNGRIDIIHKNLFSGLFL